MRKSPNRLGFWNRCVSRFRYEDFQTFVIDHESEDLIDFVLITEMGFFVLLLRLGLPS
jgi:hypothetical protein